ncbi:unnamed protein product [Calypogeia fissa]
MGGCFVNLQPAGTNIFYRKDIDKLLEQVFTNTKDWTRHLDGSVMLGSVGTVEFYVRRVSGLVADIPKNYLKNEIEPVRDLCCPMDKLVDRKCPYPGGAHWVTERGQAMVIVGEIGIQPSGKDKPHNKRPHDGHGAPKISKRSM